MLSFQTILTLWVGILRKLAKRANPDAGTPAILSHWVRFLAFLNFSLSVHLRWTLIRQKVIQRGAAYKYLFLGVSFHELDRQNSGGLSRLLFQCVCAGHRGGGFGGGQGRRIPGKI